MKKHWKKALALALTVTMALPAIGCGGKGDNSGKDGVDDGKQKRDYTYIPEYKEIDTELEFSDVVVSGEELYFTGRRFDEATLTSELGIYKISLEGGKPEKIPYEVGEEDGIFSLKRDAEGNLVFVVMDYTVTDNSDSLENVTPIEPRTIEGETEEIVDDTEDVTESDGEEGNVSEYEGEFVTDDCGYYIVKIDKDGNEIMKEDISQYILSDGYGYIQNMEIDKDGRIAVVNSESKILVFDKEGKYDFEIENTDYVELIGLDGAGNVLSGSWGETYVVKPIDMAAKQLGEPYENFPELEGGYKTFPTEDGNTICSTGNKMYLYNAKSKSSEEILDWLEVDIDSNDIATVTILDDGRIFAVHNDFSTETVKSQMVLLTKVKKSEVGEKKELTLATMYLSEAVKSAVIKFNKNSDKYRINVVEYCNSNYEEGIAKFNSDLASGKNFDLVDVSYSSIKAYEKKGIFEDLYPYIQACGINLDDYFDNVIKAYETDGKLYALVSGFMLQCVVGYEDMLGSEPTWTFTEMLDTYKAQKEDMEFMRYASTGYILSSLGGLLIEDLIDWEKGECHFNSEEFIELLEFTKDFPVDFDYEIEETESENVSLRNRNTFLRLTSIAEASDIQVCNTIFNGENVYKGMPTNSGSGVVVSPINAMFAISAKSENKDAAWEFIKYFISEDYQENEIKWEIPVLKSAFDKRMEKAMTPTYYTDENGQQQEEIVVSYGDDDLNIDIYAATQEDVDTLRNLIERVDRAYIQDEKVFEIVNEEASVFFNGQKSAKEVADIIQSRVSIYVNETR